MYVCAAWLLLIIARSIISNPRHHFETGRLPSLPSPQPCPSVTSHLQHGPDTLPILPNIYYRHKHELIYSVYAQYSEVVMAMLP